MPGLVVVRLELSLERATTRAVRRPRHLTDDEFVDLHLRERASGVRVDHVVNVGQLSLAEQIESVRKLRDDRAGA